MPDWNAGCGMLGTSTLLTRRAPTLYRDEYYGDSAKLTADEMRESHTGTKGTDLADGMTATDLTPGRNAPTSHRDDRHRPRRRDETNPPDTMTNCEKKAPT
jgi:hypothetical protein